MADCDTDKISKMIRNDFVYLDGDGGEGTKERFVQGLNFFCTIPAGEFPNAPLPSGREGKDVLLSATSYTVVNPTEVARNVVMFQVRAVNENFRQCLLFGVAMHLRWSGHGHNRRLKVAREVNCKFLTIRIRSDRTDLHGSFWI